MELVYGGVRVTVSVCAGSPGALVATFRSPTTLVAPGSAIARCGSRDSVCACLSAEPWPVLLQTHDEGVPVRAILTNDRGAGGAELEDHRHRLPNGLQVRSPPAPWASGPGLWSLTRASVSWELRLTPIRKPEGMR